MTLIEIMLVLAILATVMGVLFGPTIFRMFKSSQVKTTKLLVDKYAHQAYAEWSVNSDEQCPDSLEPLAKLLSRDNTKDPYGKPLVMLCGENAPEEANGFGVLSVGKDGKQGTPDDIASWKKPPKE